MVSSMSISIARGSCVVLFGVICCSGPFRFWRHRGQDRIDIATGLEAKGGAAVVEQVEFDVAPAAHQLLFAIRRRPRRGKIPAYQFGIDLQEGAADIPGEVEVGLPVAGIVMV